MTQAATPASATGTATVPPLVTGGTFRWNYLPGSSPIGALNVVASVGGGPNHVFQIDTGSCGIAIGRSQVGAPFDKPDPTLQPGKITYMPSGEELKGQWTPGVPVTLVNPGVDPALQSAVCTATVFIVDEPRSFAEGHGGMFGIGYQGGDLNQNPLMHAAIEGVTVGGVRLSPGYIITPEYIEVGLTDENQQGFGYAELQQDAGGEWVGPSAEVTLRGGPQFATPATLELPLLMDTGVRLMMLFADPQGLPPALQGATLKSPVIIDAATEITVDLPISAPLPMAYTFGPGNHPPEAPERAQYMGNGNGVNTGIHVLRLFDYLFDGDQMRIGFRRRLL